MTTSTEKVSKALLVCEAAFLIISIPLILGCSDNQPANSALSKKAPNTTQAPPAPVAENAASGIDSIETDNYANKKLEFYYYIPSKVIDNKQKSYPVLIFVPGLSGRGENAVTAEFKRLADQEGFIIIAPSFVFDEANWNSKTSYQYPEVWSGNALLDIIAKVKEKNALNPSKLYLHGFSAGAQFVLRFALWKPELCAACAAHASGGTVVPDKYCNVKFMVSVGKEDTDRIAKAENFYNSAKADGIDVNYRQYEGGHVLPPAEITDCMNFFKCIYSGQDAIH